MILVAATIDAIEFVREKFKDDKPNIRTNVDTIGVGGPVKDRVSQIIDERGWSDAAAFDVNVGLPAKESEKYENLRSESYFTLAQKAQQRILRLPDCPHLRAELYGMKWTNPTSRGRTKLEAKEVTKSRIKRSPDHADAAMLTEYEAPVRSIQWEWV